MVAAKLNRVRIADEIRSDETLSARVQRASEILASEIGNSAGLVNAEWTFEPDGHGCRVLRLRVSDFTGEASTSFAREELESEPMLHRRALRLWGDLLQDRSHRQLEELQEVVQRIGAD